MRPLEEYDSAIADLNDFGASTRTLLEKVLTESSAKLHQISFRVKSKASSDRKIVEHPDEYKAYTDLHDLLGIRIVLLFEADIDTAVEIVEQMFNFDSRYSVDKLATHKPTEFGYRSKHFVGELTQERQGLPENSRFLGRRIEFQIRSILQHAWAEIEHDLGYKPGRPIPDHLRRRFSQLAAAGELSDELFNELRAQLDVIDTAAVEELSESITESPGKRLDVAQLSALARENADISAIDHHVAATLRRDVIPPGKNFRAYIGNIVDACARVGVLTTEDVLSSLDRHRSDIVREAKSLSDSRQLDFEVRPGVSLLLLAKVLADDSRGERSE